MAEVQSWPRKTRCGDAPREREAAGSASRAARAILRSHLGSWRRQGSPGQKGARPAGTRPAPSGLHPEPGHWLTWDNLSRSGKAASGS